MLNASKLEGVELVPVRAYNAPEEICRLFGGRGFPVIVNNRICLATYEREIDGLFINRELQHEEILKLAVKEAEAIYHDAVTQAGQEVTKMLCNVYAELQKLNPPWEK